MISIHAPREGSDFLCLKHETDNHYFNPRSPRGERRRSPTNRTTVADFNPRSPRGERRKYYKLFDSYSRISIHAPREGSDNCIPCFSLVNLQFQSTLPARGATAYIRHRIRRKIFQSTLPARGATTIDQSSNTRHSNFNPRSPRGERRRHDRRGRSAIFDFNPRSPRGERHYLFR